MQRKITKRKDGRYTAFVELPKRPDGSRNRVPVYGKTESEVEEKLIEIEYEKKNSIYVKGSSATLESYLNEWIKIYVERKAETTAELYKMYIEKHINPEIGGLVLKKVLPFDIQKYVNKKLKDLSPNTVNKLFVLLNRAFSDAVKNQLLKSNPCDGVDRVYKKKYKPRVCTESDILKLLDLARGTFDEICIVLAAFIGLRRGEVFGLRWEDIDFKNKKISIKKTKVRWNKYIEKEPKNESSCRTIKVPEFVIVLLENYRNGKKVLTQYACDEYKPQSYSKHFKKLLEDNKLPAIRFHDLRHYNATMMLRYGVADKVAAGRLGHAQVSTTREIYQHVLEDMDTNAANIIDEVYKKKVK